MTQQLILELIDGQAIEATLASPFSPDDNEIHVLLAKNKKRYTLPLSELCCILLGGAPDQTITLSEEEIPDDDTSLEEVETISGKHFHVRVIDGQDYNTGFYAFPVESQTPYKLIFFVFDGIKIRSQHSLLCEILEQKGFVPSAEIEKTLEKQRALQSRRVGEIISEQTKISINDVEEVLLKSHKGSTIPPNTRVGDILVSEGLVTRKQVDMALASQKAGKKKKIGKLLVECGFVTEDQILLALSTKFRMRFVNLQNLVPDEKALSALTEDLVHKLQVFPIEYHKGRLVVATSRPTDSSISDIIRFSTNQKLELVVATSLDISEAIKKYFSDDEDIMNLITEGIDDHSVIAEEEEPEESVLNESDSQIVRLCNRILMEAYEKEASDIHFEPGTRKGPMLVRYRSDGLCKVVHRIPPIFKKPLLSRIKIISGLDITEHRRPQSGKILLSINKKRVEYRVEITPTVGGNEDAVLRVLSSSIPLSIDQMDFSSINLDNFKQILAKPYGIILCVGPTGAGKTTTLHSALSHINMPTRKIWTAEDPVEITQPGLRQVHVNPKIGYTFQEAFRSFLRADPDVIMIGEMRDSETAKIAIEASLTGHLVFSTLHTNSAPETIVRLTEMGLDPLSFSDALLCVLSQRLTLRLCNHCKEPYNPSQEQYEELVHGYDQKWFKEHNMESDTKDLTLMRKVGCKNCAHTGYKGRIALHELLVGTKEIKTAIKKQLSASEIEKLMLEQGMRTLKMDGIQKIFQGITDLSQILKVCL